MFIRTHLLKNHPVIVSVAAIGLLSGIGGGTYYFSQAEANTEVAAVTTAPAIAVEATAAIRTTLTKTIQVVGDIASSEDVDLRPEITGRIEHIAFEDGQDVKAGDLLIKLDSSVQEAELDRARANLNLWQNNVARYSKLVETGAVSSLLLEEAQAEFNLARANVKFAEATLAKTRIKAPFNSKAGIRQVSPGAYVSPGESLVNLDRTDKVKVFFTVPERYLHDLKQGVEVTLSVDSLPGESLKATVHATESRVASDSRSIRVLAIADNRDNKLYPGEFVTVTLPITQIDDAILIPDQALVPLGGEVFVFKVENNSAIRVAVKTGLRADSSAQILTGLSAGDMVVTAGHQKIQDGARVEVSKPTVVRLLPTPEETETVLN